MTSEPFFSIGITTYNRTEMLVECITSVLSQSFSDFEVIVGNDYPLLSISHELLGITDPRARFLNYAENLGELGNMRHLLEEGRGRYFTWLADDDTYPREFLALAHAVLKSQNLPPVLFTGYSIGQIPPEIQTESLSSKVLVLSGREFLRGYLKRSFKVIGCYGLFDINYLRKIGGMEKLGNGFSPYSDNLLAIRSGLCATVVLIDVPLVFFRTHADSISYTSPDVDAYLSAQYDLLMKSMAVLMDNAVKEDFQENLSLLLEWCFRDYYSVILRSGRVVVKQWYAYLVAMKEFSRFLDKRHRLRLSMFVLRFPPLSLPSRVRSVIGSLRVRGHKE